MQIFNHDTINEKYKNCTLMVMHCYDAELILSNGPFLFLLGNTKIQIEYSDLNLNSSFSELSKSKFWPSLETKRIELELQFLKSQIEASKLIRFWF